MKNLIADIFIFTGRNENWKKLTRDLVTHTHTQSHTHTVTHTHLWVDECEVFLCDGQHLEAASHAELGADAVQVARLGGHIRAAARVGREGGREGEGKEGYWVLSVFDVLHVLFCSHY